jgi:hypothetical protein
MVAAQGLYISLFPEYENGGLNRGFWGYLQDEND